MTITFPTTMIPAGIRRALMPLVAATGLVLAAMPTSAQTFSVDEYRRFLERNDKLTADGLESMHSAGLFRATARTNFSRAQFGDSIANQYSLTDYEKSLIGRNGFMVTERLSHRSFGEAFLEIYNKDLPVFVSTDAILHALHRSYDAVLVSVERNILIPKLDSLLLKMHGAIRTGAVAYEASSDPLVQKALDDADVYLTVARRLLADESQTIAPLYARNATAVNDLIALIDAEEFVSYPIFADAPRDMDFSQFTVRGHYTDDAELGRYFRAMMWLGRTEIYLGSPDGAPVPPDSRDIKRQTILAAMLVDAIQNGNAMPIVDDIDRTLRFMIGESDNVTVSNFIEVMGEAGVNGPIGLTESGVLKRFQTTLTTKPYAEQRILSQVLYSGLGNDSIRPATAFLLLGQRFVIDSYVLGNVVHDKVQKRMLPSALDALFALGNDAALHLLEPEIEQYGYAKNLAGLRYLIDSYKDDFWSSSLYNGWLGAIRTLNPPAERTELPSFMRTAAWWQQKMNTQLASWAQLRHDNLLYAKQSYSGGITCSYPAGYVEPIPAFYDAVAKYAEKGEEIFNEMNAPDIAAYFKRLAETSGTLKGIAEKELRYEGLSTEEIDFLRGTIEREMVGCGEIRYDGWYPSLFYVSDDVAKPDYVVADVHTAPTDEFGNTVGWVMHVGTGDVNLAVIVCEDGEGNSTAYVGPVMSYHEVVTNGFTRLTDELWEGRYRNERRPALTNIYLANRDGEGRGEEVSLRTEASDVEDAKIPRDAVSLGARSFLNSSGEPISVEYSVPQSLSGREVVVAIYDVNGRLVKELVRESLRAGDYRVRWNARNSDGENVTSGAYLWSVQVGGVTESGRIDLVR